MINRFATRVVGLSVLGFALVSCGLNSASETNSAVVEGEMSIEDYLGLLAESDEELVELGLKKGKSKGNKEQKQKAVEKAKANAKPVVAKAKAVAQKKASVKAKKAANEKKNPEKAAAAKKPENVKKSLAQKTKLKEQKLAKKVNAGKKKISAEEKKIRNLQKRKANLGAAMVSFRDVKKMPNKGLEQILAKCDAIAEAATTLRETKSPQRPFDGMRKSFLQNLRKQRDVALKVNGLTSCGAARKLAASLPPTAPEPEDIADLPIEEVDALDAIPLEAADLVDVEVAEAEAEAELEAEMEMVDAEMEPEMAPEAVVAPPDAGAAVGGSPELSGCEVFQADGAKIFQSLTASEAACRTTCTALDSAYPGSTCSFNGAMIPAAPAKVCVIISAEGTLLTNMMALSSQCVSKCAEFAAAHPMRSCSWDGSAIARD